MKFKVGDRVVALPNGINIWVHAGKTYTVLDIITKPAQSANTCYRDCGHEMHDAKPETYFVEVIGELDGIATIHEDCFELEQRMTDLKKQDTLFHVSKDPDDTEGFTNDCYQAFCNHYGYGFPPEKSYESSARKLWNDPLGSAFRYAWGAACQYAEKVYAEKKART